MRVMAAALVVLALACAGGAGADGDSCAACTAQALCATHLEAEKAALEAFTSAWKDKSPEKRIAAIDELAKVNAGHDNARSKTAAQAMIVAFKDPALPVRAEAARQLGLTQDAATAFPVLFAETDKQQKKIAGLDLKKARGTPEYSDDITWLGALYTGLAGTKNLVAGACFCKGLEMMNADVVHLAAEQVEKVRSRSVIDSLLVALNHLGNAMPSAQVNAAWLVVCAALPKLTGNHGIAPQKDAEDTQRFMGDWKDWWSANRSHKEFE